MILLNPKKLTRKYAEERSARIMQETVAFFEAKGLKKVKEDDQNRVCSSIIAAVSRLSGGAFSVRNATSSRTS